MHIETEVKFHIADLDKLAAHLKILGATLAAPRTHELNLRFDTPAGDILREACVLRLRRDSAARLTFKGVSTSEAGILSREEIEFVVSDFDAAQRFIEALGYIEVATYEKYRTTYAFGDFLFMLDELPYGNFLEIEGKDISGIQKIASDLGLNWDVVVDAGYLGIFRRLCSGRNMDETNLTFALISKDTFSLKDVSIFPADK